MQRDIEKYTQDYLSHSYDFETIMVSFRRKKVLEFLQTFKARRVLEIGCGQDSIMNYYKEFESFSIVEPSHTFAAQAREDCKDIHNVVVINDFVENRLDELREQKFDFIILSSLLHEVSNPRAFLQDIFSLCDSQTILHINVPNAHSFHLLWAYEGGIIETLGEVTKEARAFQRHTAFTLQSLVEFVSEVCSKRIDIVDKGSYFIKPFNHKKMSECIQQGIIDEALLQGLDKMTEYCPNLGAEIFVNCQVK